MENAPQVILFLLLITVHLGIAQNTNRNGVNQVHVGVILDLGSLVGKIAKTSILLAIEDFYALHPNYTTRVVMHIKDSMGSSVQAASEALDLLTNYNVKAIIGPQKSSEVFFVSEIANKSKVPIISFTATSPSLTFDNIPYFVRATINDSTQVNSIAYLIKHYKWREVVPIYIETDYGRSIIPDLLDALEGNLKAKELGMMTKGYVWIITFGVASLIDSLNPSVLEAMNGALGVEVYVPRSTELDNFTARWTTRFRMDNPNDPQLKLSIFGLWGYDTMWAVAQAAEQVKFTNEIAQMHHMTKSMTSLETLKNSGNGQEFLNAIVQYKFKGLSGYFNFSARQLQSSTFQIINIVGKGWREIGFWSAQDGFSRKLTKQKSNRTYLSIEHDLNPAIWPGESTDTPRGWEIPTSGKKLQVGVCTSSGYPEYIYAEKDLIMTGMTKASGLAVEVFEEAVKRLPYALPYEYVFYNATGNISSSYDDFVYQVYLKKYDMAIGDITIRYKRSSYVDFSLPYTESGVAMIVPLRESINPTTWIFLKPLTPGMWFGSIILFIYTGIVVWLLEFLGNSKNARGPIPTQMVMIYYSLFVES
uniref:Ionotropic glutamate receptor C-terminal domain-containing protein n=1 Tax=Oryza brachyantha TaxID=4533 RepID=J3MXN6_ORYBR